MDYLLKIKNLITRKNVKTYELASKVGVGPNTINNWLAGRNPMPVDKYVLICDFFEVPYSYFFEENANETRKKEPEELSEIEKLLKENSLLKDKIILLQDKLYNMNGYKLNDKVG